MKYQEFVTYVKEHILDEMKIEEGAKVVINTIVKNNAVTLDGLCIKRPNEMVTPTIYLNPYYDDYLSGKPIRYILGDIVNRYEEGIDAIPIENTDIATFDTVKNHIIVRLVNYEKNKEQLQDCPHIPFMDLAITFRWVAHQDEQGVASALISKKEQTKWSVSTEELLKIGMHNTISLFPSCIKNLQELLEEYYCEEFQTDSIMTLYVITNRNGINGATCILYPKLLQNFANQMESDLYILPSSVHEVIVVLAKEVDGGGQQLENLVREVNENVVSATEILSDHVYYYKRESNIINLWKNGIEEI